MELLQDFRSGYDDLQYARELEAAEDEEARATTADAADPSESVFESDEPAPTIPEQDTVVEGDAPPRKRARYSKEQLAILQREYDRGTSRLSNKEIAVEIDLKPEGIGRKVAQDDVKNWMYAKARRGEVKDFTGIDAPFEKPENPTIEITDALSIEECVKKILAKINL